MRKKRVVTADAINVLLKNNSSSSVVSSTVFDFPRNGKLIIIKLIIIITMLSRFLRNIRVFYFKSTPKF